MVKPDDIFSIVKAKVSPVRHDMHRSILILVKNNHDVMISKHLVMFSFISTKDVRIHFHDMNSINSVIRLGLPWQGLKAAAKSAKYDKICERKLQTSLETLCVNLPCEFCTYLQYCRQLEFTDEPNYHYLLELFDDLFLRHSFVRDYIYDWNLIRFRRQSSSSRSNSKENTERPIHLTKKRSKSLTPVVAAAAARQTT